MNSLAVRFSKLLRISPTSLVLNAQRGSKSWFSTSSYDADNGKVKDDNVKEDFDESIPEKPQFQSDESIANTPEIVPGRGWACFADRAIICGKVGQEPIREILRNGRTVTVFTLGTGEMFDQRLLEMGVEPKPSQWYRIAVHSEALGAYAFEKLTKNASVHVEGDIEISEYNDEVSGEVKTVPEICVRRDGRLYLMMSRESLSKMSLDELPEELL